VDIRPERLGERVRELRYRRGLTQAQLAYKAGVGEKTLKRVEAGQTDTPRPETLAAIAGALGVKTEALFESAEGVVTGPQTATPAIHQLPRPPQSFVGRHAELLALETEVRENGAQTLSIHGMGGVGKTAFALVLAERLSERFPDGQLCVDLRGEGSAQATAEAMLHVLRSLDPARSAPKTTAEISAAYRSVLRDSSVLLLFENVASLEQVEALRPPASCLLIVTSRQRIALPVGLSVGLTPLEAADARALIDKLAPRARAIVDTLAELCGRLPLALSLAGRALAERPDLDAAEYAARLADDASRLSQLDASETSGGIQASFELSLEMLEASLRAELPALSVFPQSFDRGAAAAVWQIDEDAADARIGRLVRLNLLESDGSGPSARYRLHDLVRLFLGARLVPAERLEIGLRHAEHYLERLAKTDRAVRSGHDPLASIAGIDLEWSHVRAAFAFCRDHAATSTRAAELCSRAPDSATALRLRVHASERIAWCEDALAVASARGDGRLEARLLAHAGRAHQELGDPKRARELCEAAEAKAQSVGDDVTRAYALAALGDAHHALGEASLAIDAAKRGLALARAHKAAAEEAGALVVLAWGYQVQGESALAVEHAEAGLPIARELGDRSLEGSAVLVLAFARQSLGDVTLSQELGEESLRMARELGDRRMEGYSLLALSRPLSPTPHVQTRHDEALAIARETGDRRMEGYALIMEGMSRGARANIANALEQLEQALAVAQETGDRAMLGNALSSLGVAYSFAGDVPKAIERLGLAERVFSETGNARGEALAAWLLGSAHELRGETERALSAMERAAAHQERTGQPALAQTLARIAALRGRRDAGR
jgi:transcriptional regulator with XRE-family HTH domain/tetratricopeptide (TPR) repeat protein